MFQSYLANLPENLPGPKLSENLSEHLSEHLSENLSDNLSENLPGPDLRSKLIFQTYPTTYPKTYPGKLKQFTGPGVSEFLHPAHRRRPTQPGPPLAWPMPHAPGPRSSAPVTTTGRSLAGSGPGRPRPLAGMNPARPPPTSDLPYSAHAHPSNPAPDTNPGKYRSGAKSAAWRAGRAQPRKSATGLLRRSAPTQNPHT